MKKQLQAISMAALAMAAATSAQAQTTISTPAGGTYIFNWVQGAYGQSFVVGSDTRLDEFSFWIQGVNGGLLDADYRAYVYGWDAVSKKATGYVWDGGLQNLTIPAGAGYQKVTSETGGLELVQGNSYVAFLFNYEVWDQESDSGRWSTANGNVYAGGSAVYHHTFDIASIDGGGSWGYNYGGIGYDMQFEMVFNEGTVTPEPVTMTLMGTGLAGLAAARRRRRAVM